MQFTVISSKTPREIRAAIQTFSRRYVDDWATWMGTPQHARPEAFGRILRRWQAGRPRRLRRLRSEAQHEAPFLEDLLEASSEYVRVLEGLDLRTFASKTRPQVMALDRLWTAFSSDLLDSGQASCVGITKAVLLVTDGRIGPALDSTVRRQLRTPHVVASAFWIQILEGLAADLGRFEATHGPLGEVVPRQFANLGYGRLVDMALGPR